MTKVPIKGTIVPNMSTIEQIQDEASALFGKTRREVLDLLFGQPDRDFYVREIIAHLDLGRGSVQRELSRMTEAGLLVRTTRGNQVYYQANRQSPVFKELVSFIIKTTGVAGAVREALAPLSGKLAAALIFGSFAEGGSRAASDVDVMVIGDITFKEVSTALTPAQGKLGREINPTVYSVSEFKRKVKSKQHFLIAVMEGPKIMVLGDEDELRAMVE